MSNLAGKKILLVEDDTFLANAMKIRLEEHGVTLVHALNGEKALELMRAEKPDVVLLDLMMPQKDGFSVLKEVKKDEKLREIPIIVVSNLNQQADIDRVMSLGAKDVLAKSEVSTVEILETIGKYVG